MKIQILGCSGGISEGLKTTSLLVNDSILVDAGTGIGDLPLEMLRKIKAVFVTHSHLDHICGIPLLVDTIFDSLSSPLNVYGRPETIAALQKHIFNNVIWPDFTVIPNSTNPVLKLNPIALNTKVTVNGVGFESLPVNHIVPACGYRISTQDKVFAISGDTTSNDCFWDALNKGPKIDMLIVEAAFSNAEIDLCKLAYHYCPDLLAQDLKKLKHKPEIYLTHLKPGAEKTIFKECQQAVKGRKLKLLLGGSIFHI